MNRINEILGITLVFDPEDFLDLGNYLYTLSMNSSLSEASYRTIIGRTYFFSYLFVRKWAKRHGFIPTNKATDHVNIRKFLLRKKKRFISDLLKNLRTMRNKSDYNLEANIHAKNTEKALKLANKIKMSL